MQKLKDVEDAKTLLNVAKDWGTWKWLTEKKRVRATADKAWAALQEVEDKAIASWMDDLRKAFREEEIKAELETDPSVKNEYEQARKAARHVDPKIKALAKRLKEADDEAYRAKMQAEETFDEAEKRLSTSMAREGSRQAIKAYEMREKVIRQFEAAAHSAKDSTADSAAS